eukprot:scaffold239973_cov24-Tisochrysis_lutea.AAC.2
MSFLLLLLQGYYDPSQYPGYQDPSQQYNQQAFTSQQYQVRAPMRQQPAYVLMLVRTCTWCCWEPSAHWLCSKQK